MSISNVLLVSGSANFSTRDVWDGYRHGLEAAGVNVVPYPTFSFLKVLSVDAVCSDILGTALNIENRIDCVVFVDGLYFRGKRASIPQSIRRAGIPTALVATDDPYETIPNIESLYTYRFTNEIQSATGGAYYLPTATLPLPEIPRVENPKYDVSFLGTVFEDRVPVLKRVAQHCEETGRRFLIAGKFLEGASDFRQFMQTDVIQRTIDQMEKWEVYSQSRVTLNLFRNSEESADSPSPRVFEVTAFGQAALVTGPSRSEVERIYGDSVYTFDDEASALAAIDQALADDQVRHERVDRAKQITWESHLYEHRASKLIAHIREGEQQQSVTGTDESKVGWVIGCGRTGSTWLAEMLGDLPRIRRWHEPYFGRFLRHLEDRPQDRDRPSSFFAKRHEQVWKDGLRRMFFEMVRERYPEFGRHSLAIKEVNTPEFYRWIKPLFPTSQLILLIRDPFDVLDSYLDLQKPGSWNDRFGDSENPLSESNVRRTARHIEDATIQALSAYDNFPVEQRLMISYEQLLEDPVPSLIACAELLSVDIDADAAARVADKRTFENYKETGTLKFRRRGQAGVWKASPNFTQTTRSIANEVLGPVRTKLGYGRDE